MISLETKAHYYEKLFKIMTTPPKKGDDIHGVYSPGEVKRTTYQGKPYVYLKWEILRGKLSYHLGVVPWYADKILLFGELHFIKTPQVQIWVNQKRDSQIIDKGDHYEWKVKASEASDFFNDVRLQSINREIPSDLLNQAAFTVRDRFSTFCQGFGSNPYFDLYSMLR